MVDPVVADEVVADDGNTYERKEILKWIAVKSISPLDPSCRVRAHGLRSVR